MTDNCDLTLYVLSKGGTACVFGTCQNSLNWSALATDFLVINLMSNPRYQKVVCLNFESTNLVSRFDTLSACSGKRGSSERPATSNPPPILSNHLPAKLTVITAQYSDAESQYTVKNAKEKEEQEANIETVGMWDTVLAEIAASLAAGGDSPSARSAPLITVGASGNVAVVIYSLSELILTVGLAETRNFIRKLSLLLQNTNTTRTASQQQQPSCGPESSAAPTTRASTITSTHAPTATMPLPTPTTALVPCILLPVHQSLHGPAVLAQIQALASVLVRVVPNSGTLADTVACEIQTVRR